MATLPDHVELGDTGHVSDTNMLIDAIADLEMRKVETLAIGTVTTGDPGTPAMASIHPGPAGTSTLDLTIPQGPQGIPGDPGSPGPPGLTPPSLPLSRATATLTTTPLADGAVGTGTVDLARSYRLLRISTNAPARVRLYISTAARDADLARPVGTDPTGDHGLMVELITTSGDLDWALSPTVDGFLDGSGSAIPYAVTNISGGAAAITAQFTYIATEA